MIGFIYITLVMLAVFLLAPFAYRRIDTGPPQRGWPKPWHTPAW